MRNLRIAIAYAGIQVIGFTVSVIRDRDFASHSVRLLRSQIQFKDPEMAKEKVNIIMIDLVSDTDGDSDGDDPHQKVQNYGDAPEPAAPPPPPPPPPGPQSTTIAAAAGLSRASIALATLHHQYICRSRPLATSTPRKRDRLPGADAVDRSLFSSNSGSLRPHQTAAIEWMTKREKGDIFRWCTEEAEKKLPSLAKPPSRVPGGILETSSDYDKMSITLALIVGNGSNGNSLNLRRRRMRRPKEAKQRIRDVKPSTTSAASQLRSIRILPKTKRTSAGGIITSIQEDDFTTRIPSRPNRCLLRDRPMGKGPKAGEQSLDRPIYRYDVEINGVTKDEKVVFAEIPSTVTEISEASLEPKIRRALRSVANNAGKESLQVPNVVSILNPIIDLRSNPFTLSVLYIIRLNPPTFPIVQGSPVGRTRPLDWVASATAKTTSADPSSRAPNAVSTVMASAWT